LHAREAFFPVGYYVTFEKSRQEKFKSDHHIWENIGFFTQNIVFLTP